MIRGTCDPAFRSVREAFAANFEQGEVGAACSVTSEGRVVVDIWGRWADAEHQREWAHDTIVNAYSVGKPVVALMLLQLVERGRVELDAPRNAGSPSSSLASKAPLSATSSVTARGRRFVAI